MESIEICTRYISFIVFILLQYLIRLIPNKDSIIWDRVHSQITNLSPSAIRVRGSRDVL
jgi:hypothetical protein